MKHGIGFLRATALATVAGMALSVGVALAPTDAHAQGTLRLGMTAADIPASFGQPDNGFEGYRWMGLMVYDALINFDLTQGDEASGLVPGLAESWEVDPDNDRRWIFNLRQGVKFHDGSEFNAEAVVFNLDKLLDQDSPQYSARQASLGAFRIPAAESWSAIDEYTLEIITKEPEAMLPFQVCYILISSPAQWEATGRDWDKFAETPSGTGPWRLTEIVPRERAVFEPFEDHWDETRVPKLERVITIPIPDPSARTAAILSGQVDWIEQPAPDAVPRLQQQGLEITSNVYPHIWSWHFSRLDDSPWNDVRVRKAANLAIDRAGMKELLGGFAVEATGHVVKGGPWYGEPEFEITYDVDAARALMEEAGFGPDNRLRVVMNISASGSGQMLPLQMNEYMQENLRDIYIDVDFKVMEWQALLDLWRAGAKSSQAAGTHGINVSYAIQDPFNAFTRFVRTDLAAPAGVNYGFYSDPEMDELLQAVSLAFDPDERDAALARVHEKMVDEALFLWVVHDTAPRAMTPAVKGFVQAQNWFQSLTSVYIEQ